MLSTFAFNFNLRRYNTGPAMAVGNEFSFSGRMYAVWPCELGMTALFWADIKIALKDMFEAEVNVFASCFCGVKTGKLMHFVASLPLDKKIKIADMIEARGYCEQAINRR